MPWWARRAVPPQWRPAPWPTAASRKPRDRSPGSMATGERIRLGVERIEDQTLIGICTLFDLNKECRSAEIGYGLISAAWGNGYMHEALLALLDYGFSVLGLNRVQADIDPRNKESAKSLERIGFKKEGHLRENSIVNGALTDSALYGLLRSEWRGATRGGSTQLSPAPGSS